MIRVFIILILIFLNIGVKNLIAQQEMFKALFIFSFAKNIDWTPEYNSGDFIIAVYGKTPVNQHLEKYAQTQTIGEQSVIVKNVSSVDEIEKCHIFYIPKNKTEQLNYISQKFYGKPTLIVSDKKGLKNKRTGINFISSNDGSLEFEINRDYFKSNGLKVSSFLIGLSNNN